MDAGPSCFPCTFQGCLKTFTRKDHLQRHAANHSSESHDCPICGRQFKRFDLLQRHEKRNVCGGDEARNPYISHGSNGNSASNNGSTLKRRRTSDSDDLGPPGSAISTVHPNSATYPHLNTSTSAGFNSASDPTASVGLDGNGNGNGNGNGTANGDFALDWNLGIFPPEQWEAFLPETFAPPFNQPISVDPNWQVYQPRLHQLEPQPQHQPLPNPLSLAQPLPPPFPLPQPPIHTHPTHSLNHPHSHPHSHAYSLPRLQPQSAERNQTAHPLYPPGQESEPEQGHGHRHGQGQEQGHDQGYGHLERDGPQPESQVTEALLGELQTSFPELDISPSFATNAISSYWSNTAPSYPFIHRATFDLATSTHDLTAMMIVVGSVHRSPRRDFSQLVQKIRGRLVQGCGLDMPISTLQAFCLCHVYDTWYNTVESMFVAQCMWPVMVSHSRKKGIGVAGRQDRAVHQGEAWSAWAQEEERRRAAYCVLLIDTQISAFWNQHCSRQLSIFAHNLALPCSKSQWEANSAHEWLQVREREAASSGGSTGKSEVFHSHTRPGQGQRHDQVVNNKPNNTHAHITTSVVSVGKSKTHKLGYLPGLDTEFTVDVVAEGYSTAILATLAEKTEIPFKVGLESSLTTQMVLIGLIAIAWDCRTRGGMGIRFRQGTKHWRTYVFSAVIHLRAAYEKDVVHMSENIESKDLRDTFAICIISTLSDIPMLHVAAGATSFCGATIGPGQYAEAKRRLKLWAKTDDAWTCVWQSVRYLRQCLFSEWGVYSSWAIFNTTLVLWAYTWATALDSAPVPLPPPHTNDSKASLQHQHQQHASASLPPSASTSVAHTPNPAAVEDKQKAINLWLHEVLHTQGMLQAGSPGLEDELKQVIDYVAERLVIPTNAGSKGPGPADADPDAGHEYTRGHEAADSKDGLLRTPLRAGYGGQAIDRENSRLLRGLMRYNPRRT